MALIRFRRYWRAIFLKIYLVSDVTEGVAAEFYNKTTSNKPLEFSTEENGDYKYGDSSLCHMMPDGIMIRVIVTTCNYYIILKPS